MKLRLLSIALLASVLGTFVLAPYTASAVVNSQSSGMTNIPVSGKTSDGGTFSGVLSLTEFAVQNGQLVANGVLSGTATNVSGQTVGTVTNQAVILPVTSINATCELLHLELGPVDLDLLGLNVHLDKVVLDISADPTGGLLGSLLCSLANALSAGGPLTVIADLLNQILAVLLP